MTQATLGRGKAPFAHFGGIVEALSFGDGVNFVNGNNFGGLVPEDIRNGLVIFVIQGIRRRRRRRRHDGRKRVVVCVCVCNLFICFVLFCFFVYLFVGCGWEQKLCYQTRKGKEQNKYERKGTTNDGHYDRFGMSSRVDRWMDGSMDRLIFGRHHNGSKHHTTPHHTTPHHTTPPPFDLRYVWYRTPARFPTRYRQSVSRWV